MDPVTTGDVGSWVHLVGTFDGTTTRLYKNGALMQSLEASGTLTTGAGVTRIGLLGMTLTRFQGRWMKSRYMGRHCPPVRLPRIPRCERQRARCRWHWTHLSRTRKR